MVNVKWFLSKRTMNTEKKNKALFKGDIVHNKKDKKRQVSFLTRKKKHLGKLVEYHVVSCHGKSQMGHDCVF